MADAKQIILDAKASIQNPPDYAPYAMPPSPPLDPSTLQQQIMGDLKPGQSTRMKIQQVDPNSIYMANQQLDAVRNYNQNAYKETIKRVADTVAENIKKSEKTAQILQGTAYEGQPFYGGVIAKDAQQPENSNARWKDINVELAPAPSVVSKNIEYMAPPKYEPKFNTVEVSAKKDQEKDRGNTGSGTPRNDLTLEKLDFNQFNESGTTTKIPAAKNPVNEFFTTPTYLLGRAAAIGDANITTIDGRSFANTQFDVTPQYTEYTDSKYKEHGKNRNAANRTQKLTGPKAADVLLTSNLSEMVKNNDATASAFWRKLQQRVTNDGNLVFRANTPTNVAETFDAMYDGKKIKLPILKEESQTQKKTFSKEEIEKLYSAYMGKNSSGNPDKFTQAILRGEIRPPTGGMYDVGLQSEFNNVIYKLAYKIGKQIGLRQQDPSTLTDAVSREDQYMNQVRGIADQLRAMLLGQQIPGAYSSHDILQEDWEKQK